jgi:hypothetical protein
MKDALESLAARLDHFGRLPVFGVLLALAAAVLFVASSVPTAAENRALAVRAAQAEAAAGEARKAKSGAPEAVDFDRFFKRPERETDWLRKLHDLAAQQGIALNQASYATVAEADLGLVRYQVTLPVQATYPQVRRFVASLLNEIPVLALESVTFERKEPTAPVVDAQLKLTLFLPAGR